MLLLIDLAISQVRLSLPADGNTNLGGQKPSEPTSNEGVISPFVSGTGNLELLGQLNLFPCAYISEDGGGIQA